MLKLLQRPINVLDDQGKLVSTAELWLGNYVLMAKQTRIAHAMVLYSDTWGSTPEARAFWVDAALRARQKAHEYALRYREACADEALQAQQAPQTHISTLCRDGAHAMCMPMLSCDCPCHPWNQKRDANV